MSQPLVFVSYSRKDEAQKDKLLSQLGVLSVLFDVWNDDRIAVGANWKAEIEKSINQAKVAILLITDNFLSSPFIIKTEVQTILERREKQGLRVFPVIAKACAWTRVKWLSEMNVRPKNRIPVWGDAGVHVDEDLAKVVEEVADILERMEEVVTETAPAPSPPAHETETVKRDTVPTSDVPKAPAVVKAVKPTGSAKILVADDDARLRRTVIEGLSDLGIVPFEADSIRKAIQTLDRNPDIRVILLDLEFKDDEKVTVLLDHIKDRSSYYRVIILTSYPHLFAAEQVSSYDIFRFFEKTEAMAPTVSLRYEVTRALDELKREGHEPFGEAVVRQYPTPFIYIYEQLHHEMPPLEKLMRQRDMHELLIHFSGILLACEYLNSKTRTAELDVQIQNRILRPGLGDWFNIINEIVKGRTEDNDGFFLRAFLPFFSGRNKKTISDLIGIRNRFVGHGVSLSEYEYEEIIKQCDTGLDTLLRDYQFITTFLLCQVLNVQIIRGERRTYLYSLKECVGTNRQLLVSTKPLNLELTTNEMHLLSPHNDPPESLSLYPLMVLEFCPECRHVEIFFFTKFSNNQLHYLSYQTGHRIVKDSAVQDFRDLVNLPK